MMQHRVDHIDEVLRHGNLLAGKRLRPIALLLVAGAAGRIDPRHIRLAAALEMIHSATLMHDDVLDSANLRRHLPTIHAKWNVPTSILVGDYLFSNAFMLAASTGDARACQLIGQATNLVCEGELQQNNAISNLELTEAEYLEIIAGKTGQLISCGTRLGTYFQTDAPPTAQPPLPNSDPGQPVGFGSEIEATMVEFGQNLGIAFQIFDDILDLTGQTQSTGKSLHTDFLNQKATLPLIRGLQTVDGPARRQLVEFWSSPMAESNQRVAEILEANGAIDASRETATGFAEQARACLAPLSPSPYREALEAITEFVVQRNR